MAVQLHAHVDTSYDSSKLLPICREEGRLNQASHSTLHLDWELLAYGMDVKPGGESTNCGSRWLVLESINSLVLGS